MYREDQQHAECASLPGPAPEPAPPTVPAPPANAGGFGELLKLAWPLVLSNSFWTVQLFLDGLFLTWYDTDAVSAAMSAGILFWTTFVLLQTTTNYATTFVAQYLGAGRKDRVGPAVWQALYFAAGSGLLYLGLIPFTSTIMGVVGHSAHVRAFEEQYFPYLVCAGVPLLITAACNSFFAGRGESRVVLVVDATGTMVNAALGYCLIFGKLGLPRLGIAGAGIAMIVGSSAAAILSFGLMMRRRYREEFATLRGWRFDRELFGRLMRFGIPSGLQWFLDGLAFAVFVAVIGRIGDVEFAASSIAQRINMLAFLPMLGVGQAVMVLVGQRLGQDRPDLAERSAKTGLKVAATYMTAVALLYVLTPGLFIGMFRNDADLAKWARVADAVELLLIFVAVYSLFNSVEVVYTFTLRGAGDTVFVTWMSITLAWPIMVLPTIVLAWQRGWGLYWAWGFASAYIIAMAVLFMLRFRTGKWKSMRVIERAPGHS